MYMSDPVAFENYVSAQGIPLTALIREKNAPVTLLWRLHKRTPRNGNTLALIERTIREMDAEGGEERKERADGVGAVY